MLLAAVGSMPLWQKAAMGFGDYRTAPLFGKRCTSRNADPSKVFKYIDHGREKQVVIAVLGAVIVSCCLFLYRMISFK